MPDPVFPAVPDDAVNFERPRSTLDNVLLAVGAVLTLVCGVPMVICAFLAVRSRFGPVEADPHGYVVIFGSLFAIFAAFLTALVAPLMFPGRLRLRAYGWSLVAALVVIAGLFSLLIFE